MGTTSGPGVDGKFGLNTMGAVEAFQGDRHLVADGIVGPQTWAALSGLEGVKAASRSTLQLGSSGSDVVYLQESLVQLGYNLGTGGVDGKFGPATYIAVKAFQGDQGLVVDGIVGPKTWAALSSEVVTAGPTRPSLPVDPELSNPTALALSNLTGGQVDFYAATEGREAATLLTVLLGEEADIPGVDPELPSPTAPALPSLPGGLVDSMPPPRTARPPRF